MSDTTDCSPGESHGGPAAESTSRQSARPETAVPVIILNWNGTDDTLACLQSIRDSEPAGFVPVLVDNGSEPDSVTQLKRECSHLYRRILFLTANELFSAHGRPGTEFSHSLNEGALVFIENGENLGFAMGNNVGIKFAELVRAEWVLLLNNDTVVSPDTFQELRTFLNANPSFLAITPQVRYFDPPTRIQNCGGKLTYFGSRRYLCADQDAGALPSSGFSVVSFVTGCALLFKYKVVGALTEDYFFGEEDYEFSLRMTKLRLKMACVHGAVIYHKVGASIVKSSTPLGAILVHYVTRLLNLRNYYSKARWHSTRMLSYLYLPVLLARSGINPLEAIPAIARIEAYIKRNRTMDRAAFQSMIASK